MTLHTIVSFDDIFSAENPQEPLYEQRQNGYVSLTKAENGFVVNSLFSTNPYDYLNPNLAPGSPYKRKNKCMDGLNT